jgi:hypothetical protein
MSDIPLSECPVDSLVAKVVARITTTKNTKVKNRTDAKKAMKIAQKRTMKWLPFMATFILEKMCKLIKTQEWFAN